MRSEYCGKNCGVDMSVCCSVAAQKGSRKKTAKARKSPELSVSFSFSEKGKNVSGVSRMRVFGANFTLCGF